MFSPPTREQVQITKSFMLLIIYAIVNSYAIYFAKTVFLDAAIAVAVSFAFMTAGGSKFPSKFTFEK